MCAYVDVVAAKWAHATAALCVCIAFITRGFGFHYKIFWNISRFFTLISLSFGFRIWLFHDLFIFRHSFPLAPRIVRLHICTLCALFFMCTFLFWCYHCALWAYFSVGVAALRQTPNLTAFSLKISFLSKPKIHIHHHIS